MSNGLIIFSCKWLIKSATCCSSRFIDADLTFIAALKCPTICLVMFHLISADFFLARPTIPPLLLLSLMMVFSVAMSLHTPLKEPAFCRIAKKPTLKRDSTSEGEIEHV